MKAPILGLAVATAAFAGSSIYLWQQLDEERPRDAQVEQKAKELGARLADVERVRAQFAQNRMKVSGDYTTGVLNEAHPVGAVPQSAPGDKVAAAKPEDGAVWQVRPADRSPAFRKMMRSQIRANNKRVYAD